MTQRGPRLRVIRRLGTPLPGLSRKEAERRPYPPGVHGPATTRRRKSEYRRRLEEKQKVRFHYGVSESQLRRYFARAGGRPEAEGKTRLELLERRLDNVAFRLGFAATIPAARQLVGHGHVRVTGRRVDRPAYLVEVGDEISLSARARRMPAVAESVEHGPEVRLPSYLQLDPDDRFTGRVTGRPTREDIPVVVDEAAIVEFYAR
jgi:small subunit ribosomal protein S4